MSQNIYSQAGKVSYGIKTYTVDTESDKSNLPTNDKMGTKCYVIESQKWYILDGSGEYVPFVGEGGFGNGSPFILKGSVAAVADLPDTDNKNGDLYIVTADSSEYVWIEGDPTGHWEQLGLEAERFVVNVTSNNNQISADKTFAEITAAYNKGQILIAIYNEMDIYYLSSIVDDEIVFVQRGSASTDQISEHTLIVLYNNEWQFQTTTLKSTTATNVASAVYDMTSAQKTQTLSNLGGEPKKMVVTVTHNDQTNLYTADKTSAEIWAAYSAGKTVEVVYEGNIFRCAYAGSNPSAEFVCVSLGNATERIFNLIVDDTDFWEFVEQTIGSTVITVSGMTPTITPAHNTIYKCGELTSLTISNPPATGKYSIIFYSGATATTVTGIDNFTVEANKRYRIDVEDNYSTFDSWNWEGV